MAGLDAIFDSRLETDLIVAAHEINEEHQNNMSVQIKGLADIVKQAKAAIDTAGGAAAGMQDAAQRVVGRIQQVTDMTNQLNEADAELAAAIGTMSNGGPPLAATTASTPSATDSAAPATSPAPNVTPATAASAPAVEAANGPTNPAPNVHAAKIQVEAANASTPGTVQATADKYIQRA